MWIGRRYLSNRMWFSSQRRVVRLSVLVAALVSPCLFCCGGAYIRGQYVQWFELTAEDRDFIEASRTSRHKYREGVPSAARKLIAEMEPFDDPDRAVAEHPDWFSYRFANGEWVFGHGIDSHSFSSLGGGSMVVKDSRGATRVFLGHVCGENAGLPWNMEHHQGLDDFYMWLAERFEEWFP